MRFEPDGEPREIVSNSHARIVAFEGTRGGVEDEDFIVAERPDSVAICASTPGSADLILVRQHRFAADREGWEIPQGSIEKDEHPADAATRELREETGIRGESPRVVGSFYEVADWCTARIFVVVVDVPVVESAPAELPWRWCAPGDVEAMIASGEIFDGATLACLRLLRSLRSP